MSVPKVFVSYSHDSKSHAEWVERLSSDLRRNGIDAILDRWDLAPGQEITHFMEQIRTVDRVLCVCTTRYVEKANEPAGGVGYERMIVSAELVKDLGTPKFVPILREGAELPAFMGVRRYVDFRDDDQYHQGIEALLRDLHGAPHPGKPPLGENPFSTPGRQTIAPITAPTARGRRPERHELYEREKQDFA